MGAIGQPPLDNSGQKIDIQGRRVEAFSGRIKIDGSALKPSQHFPPYAS
jgi:hypothetical protein